MNGERQKKSAIREWTESILIALILALLLRTFIVQAFKIPTGSMRPMLTEGDRILVNKFIYRFKSPQRGDIIVFKFPNEPKKDYIKRLVALGEEEVEIRNGNIVINDTLIEEPAIFKERYYYNRGEFGREDTKAKVPEGYFYVLGDNSASSKDSRYWGFVPRKNLIGKAFVIYWPLTRIGVIK